MIVVMTLTGLGDTIRDIEEEQPCYLGTASFHLLYRAVL